MEKLGGGVHRGEGLGFRNWGKKQRTGITDPGASEVWLEDVQLWTVGCIGQGFERERGGGVGKLRTRSENAKCRDSLFS